MGALSKLVLITNRLLIMIFETFDALMTNILAIFSPKKRKSMQMSNSNEIGQKTLYQIYAKKNIVFYSAPAKKNQPKPSFGVYFPFFADLIAYAKTKNKPNSRFIFILFDHFTKSKLFVSFEFYQFVLKSRIDL